MDSLGILVAAALMLGDVGNITALDAPTPAPSQPVLEAAPKAPAAPLARPAAVGTTGNPAIVPATPEAPPKLMDSQRLDWGEGVYIDPDMNSRIQSHPFDDLGLI